MRLLRPIAVARDNLAGGTISNITTDESKPFAELVTSDKWDDVLLYHFQYNTCGQRFELSAETYHGLGGWWKTVPGEIAGTLFHRGKYGKISA
jgi:hypothetical protein